MNQLGGIHYYKRRRRRRGGLFTDRFRIILYIIIALLLIGALLWFTLPDNPPYDRRLLEVSNEPTVVVLAERQIDPDVEWMARVVWAEARGEPYAGQVAVAEVILNRVHHSGLSIRQVVTTPAQFAIGEHWNDTGVAAVMEALGGSRHVADARWFFSPANADPDWVQHPEAPTDENHLAPGWARGLRYIVTIQGHDFYGAIAEPPSRNRDQVAELQALLEERGHSVGPHGVDGRMGPDTRAAVMAFQTDAGITVDGVAGTETWALLKEG